MNWYFTVFLFELLTFYYANAIKVQVWLTVSPLANETSQRNIQIHWKTDNRSSFDWIGLFTKDPFDSSGAIKATKVDENNGYFITDVQFPYRDFPTGKLKETCLGYYVAYFYDNHLVAKNCLKTNPFWMGNHLDVIGSKSLTDIVIPGSHDAGSYERYNYKTDNILKMYQMTQDESIYNQLVYGIRYFDMRLGYHNVLGNEEKYWIVHGYLRSDNTLKSVCKQIKDFLQAAPKEIVIFDFHRFENGFNNENNQTIVKQRYNEFLKIIESHLKSYMMPYRLGYNIKINDLIKTNKRVLVGFAGKSLKYIEKQQDDDLLWPNVEHQWGNKDDVNALEKYFDNTLCMSDRRRLRSAMAEMTPTTQGSFTNKYGGLRKLAQIANLKYPQWFLDRWWKCVNIISADYVLGSNVVEIAIINNIRLNNTKIKKYYYDDDYY